MESRNVEIKCILSNYEKTLSILYKLDKYIFIGILFQKDTFYNNGSKRLKIREESSTFFSLPKREIIYYDRADIIRPKLSNYLKINIPNKDDLEKHHIIYSANGIIGVVEKERKLFMYKQTRIHVDIVAKLGFFLELEVQLFDHETLQEGEKIANDIMKELQIESEEMISCSYLDLMLKK